MSTLGLDQVRRCVELRKEAIDTCGMRQCVRERYDGALIADNVGWKPLD